MKLGVRAALNEIETDDGFEAREEIERALLDLPAELHGLARKTRQWVSVRRRALAYRWQDPSETRAKAAAGYAELLRGENRGYMALANYVRPDARRLVAENRERIDALVAKAEQWLREVVQVRA